MMRDASGQPWPQRQRTVDDSVAVDATERLLLFRERHWVPVRVLLLIQVAIVGLIALVGAFRLVQAVRMEGFGGPTFMTFLLVSNGLALFLGLFVLLNNTRRVIRVDPLHLHVGWRQISLRHIVGLQRVDGRSVREWRRELLKPLKGGVFSVGMWAASGGVSSMFCPPWMPIALVIELSESAGSDYVLVGTRRPEELESALAAAREDLRRRGPQ
jgi:hypothetical protein